MGNQIDQLNLMNGHKYGDFEATVWDYMLLSSIVLLLYEWKIYIAYMINLISHFSLLLIIQSTILSPHIDSFLLRSLYVSCHYFIYCQHMLLFCPWSFCQAIRLKVI
jgi:hypothetical protein